jgi:hypothetical protein
LHWGLRRLMLNLFIKSLLQSVAVISDMHYALKIWNLPVSSPFAACNWWRHRSVIVRWDIPA